MSELTIKTARLLADMTQVEMAKALGVAESTYAKYESYRNFMRMDTAYKFASLVNRELDDIIFLPTNYRKSVVLEIETKAEV